MADCWWTVFKALLDGPSPNYLPRASAASFPQYTTGTECEKRVSLCCHDEQLLVSDTTRTRQA